MGIYLLMSGQNKRFLVLILIASLGVLGVSLPVYAQAENEELSLEVEFVGGGNSINFGTLRNLQNDGTPITNNASNQVRLFIKPVDVNNKRPYIVTQIVQSELVNQSGAPVSSNAIRYRVQEEEGSGTVRVPDETPLTAGAEEIYRSSEDGGESQLLITYDFITAPDQEAGSYNGTLSYRVAAV